jgi:polyphosphate glucokinase
MNSDQTINDPTTLAIDIGGTGIKASVLDAGGRMIAPRVSMKTPHPCPPERLLGALDTLLSPLPAATRISIGFPGMVRHGHVLTAPNLGSGAWEGYPLEQAIATRFAAPARLINDADMQGLGAISGVGLEFMLTLGTGAGTAMFLDGTLLPHLELAHHPVDKSKTYDDYIGARALRSVGVARWNRRVRRVLAIIDALAMPDSIIVGGGNAAQLRGALPPKVRVVSNDAGIIGGVALWATSPHPARSDLPVGTQA